MSARPPLVYSVLDLSPILAGGTAADSFRNTLDLARHAERFGYHRYWLAEHHNIRSVASAATAVLVGHVAGGTKSIRVGSGGIMLPNHSPLVIAEQFGTLESLYPGRIDLGLGRAPGGDQSTARALRRPVTAGDTFPRDVAELRRYFDHAADGQIVRAVPGEGLRVPLYVLGSSDFGATLAAELGLPFAFASHFAPDFLTTALQIYRDGFKPSSQLDRPHAIVGVNVFCAETDEEADRLFTTLQQAFTNLIRGRPTPLPPPVESMDGLWSPAEEFRVSQMTRISLVGSPTTIGSQLDQLLDETDADEIIATSQIYDYSARVRSFELAADVFRSARQAAANVVTGWSAGHLTGINGAEESSTRNCV